MIPEKKPKFAKKSLGQNFLVDKNAIAKIVASVPEASELLLEIGPGRGALSTELWPRAKTYALLEKDDLFAKNIGETLFVHGSRNHHVFHNDALDFDLLALWKIPGVAPNASLVVAANLPYNVATEILFLLLELHEKIPFMALMFQKEVAERIVARCNTKAYGTVSLSVQNFYEVKIQQILKPGAFRPSPKIDSAVVEFQRRPKPIVSFASSEEFAQFRSLVKMGFSHRRKTLENTLAMEARMLPWTKALSSKEAVRGLIERVGWDAKVRAETLTVSDFGKLFRSLKE